MSDAWNMQSNIKAKKGSQGTLFQIGNKDSVLNPAQRWPRGYTPERQQAISRSLHATKIFGAEPLAGDDPRKRAQVVDTVARSTVPPGDLYGLKTIHNKPDPGHIATYWPGRREIGIDMDNSTVDGEDNIRKDSESLIHEIGHHVDNSTKETRDRAFALSRDGLEAGRIRAGVSEAVADNYHEKNYRTRGRNPQSDTQGEYEKTFPDPKERDKVVPGYNMVRPPLQEKQFPSRPDSVQGSLF